MKAQILVVEDEDSQRKILTDFLKYKGFKVYGAESATKALNTLKKEPIDLVLLDWKLPDEDGLSFLTKLKDQFPLTQVIMMTAFATVERAVEAMKRGAYHYLTKPLNLDELLLVIDRALRELRLQREVKRLKEKLEKVSSPEVPEIVAESPKMKEVLVLARKVAESEATVLILGESGTGKEVLGGLIHRLSARRAQPFLKLNCAAIPEGLLESELFGHERGAFTGADKTKLGLFEIAHQGTIFLDEIGDLSLPLQAKLLRVLQEGTFRRVGGLKEIKVDVRVIAATNRDLEQMVKEGSFREDLYWRLNVVTLRLPPLRERREDIIPLARFFLDKFNQKHGKRIKGFSKEALEALLSYHFPGNVRELENIVERAVILAEEKLITREDLPSFLKGESSLGELSDLLESLPLPEAVALLEKRRIKEAMQKAGGIKARAAELLGISERVLRYKLEKYGLG